MTYRNLFLTLIFLLFNLYDFVQVEAQSLLCVQHLNIERGQLMRNVRKEKRCERTDTRKLSFFRSGVESFLMLFHSGENSFESFLPMKLYNNSERET